MRWKSGFAWPRLGVCTFDDKFFRNLLVQLCVQPADALENESLEIKGWCRDERELTEKVVDAASCLANAQGGVVLVGIGGETNARKFSPCPFPNVTTSMVSRKSPGQHPPAGRMPCRGSNWDSAGGSKHARSSCLRAGRRTQKMPQRTRHEERHFPGAGWQRV